MMLPPRFLVKMVAAILPDISDIIAPGVNFANSLEVLSPDLSDLNFAIPWPIRSTRRRNRNKIFIVKLVRVNK